jgi:hypothetical protein
MKSRFNNTIFYLLVFITSGYTTLAQNMALIPYESSIHSYTWNNITEGSTYTFYVTANVEGETGESEFIGQNSGVVGSDGTASTEIRWKAGSSLKSYEVWLEVSISGCSNRIFIEVSPQPNNRSIGFDVVASNECFTPGGNGFELPVSLLTNNGEPLPEGHYPVNVSFTVNGVEYGQVLESGTMVLQITETMFTANYTQDTQVLVEITGASDRHSAALAPGSENSLHTRVIYAIPEIEFVRKMQHLNDLNYENSLVYNSARAGRRNGRGTGEVNAGGG